ncbi:MAG: hypothetical protein JWL95_1184, partial [Gemmatimonadetes bacterium]|nr:hypothetical protein [Gemmatimonadota bacterium]
MMTHEDAAANDARPSDPEQRLSALESELTALRAEVSALRQVVHGAPASANTTRVLDESSVVAA